jgi:hypothetical protein
MRFIHLPPVSLRAVVACVAFTALLNSQAFGQPEVADTKVGYIDSAIVGNLFRIRFDSAYGNNRPDRAEFFYGKCGCFKFLPGPLNDADAPGPPGFDSLPHGRFQTVADTVETSVDYQDISAYLELAWCDCQCLSGFVELPVRFINPEVNDNSAGFGDMNAGFKWALWSCDDCIVTFQFRAYAPTGDADRGLGTNHTSLEPALLVYKRLTDQMTLEGELRDWIPIGGTDFAGNVIRYGLGVSYDIYERCDLLVSPVAELVGWTVLDGKELPRPGPPEDAAGDTIVNIKLGVRFFFGSHSNLYAGYGRALTGNVWYEDIARVEYRLNF